MDGGREGEEVGFEYEGNEAKMDSHLGDVCRQVAEQCHGRLLGQVRLAEVCAGSKE